MIKIGLILCCLYLIPAWAQLDRSIRQIEAAISARTIPGAVLMVSDKQGKPLLEYAAGLMDRQQAVELEATIYDLASLTKVVATATSIMLLEERGRLSLQDRIQKFYPKFNRGKKSLATIEQLLRHQAGLPAGMAVKAGEGHASYLSRITKAALTYPPGSRTVYSDVGFIILADIVRKVSGQNVGDFAHANIYRPLMMDSTFYHVPQELQQRCAPTGSGRGCLPHDPQARALFPAQLGHAGLFSSGKDLDRFVQMFKNGGELDGVRVLQEKTVRKMTRLPAKGMRGLGWDIKSPYANSPRGGVFPEGVSYGHTGYTGTTIWIDPASGGSLVLLSNRVFLGDGNTSRPFIQLRRDLGTSVGRHFYPSKFWLDWGYISGAR